MPRKKKRPTLDLGQICDRIKQGCVIRRRYRLSRTQWAYSVGDQTITPQEFRRIKSMLPLVEIYRTRFESRLAFDASDRAAKTRRRKRLTDDEGPISIDQQALAKDQSTLTDEQ